MGDGEPSEAGGVRDLKRFYRQMDLSGVGVSDTDAMVDNLGVVRARRRRAEEDGYLVEAIALTGLLCEFLLILWLARKHGVRVSEDDSTTLGGWINRAEKSGFDGELIARLREFNRIRRQAIHRLLRGEIRYEALEDALSADPKLLMHLGGGSTGT